MLKRIWLFTLVCAGVWAADWPQWRGPNRDGRSAETGLMQAWPKGGPQRLWTARGLGEGYSSVAVAGNRIFTQGQAGGQQFVLALDLRTGKQIWKTSYARGYGNERGNGPRGTPTVDGARLYALAANGELVCLDTATGKRLWGFNLVERFRGRVPEWGYSESPLVDGDRVFVAPGGPGAGVVALNKSTGDAVWKSQNDHAGYSSAVPFTAGGTRGLAILTASAAIGLSLQNGQLMWRYAKVANGTANIATPIVHSGQVFVSSDYGTGCALLSLTADGKASEVYFNRDMRNHYTTSVLVGDHLYGFSSSILTAMNLATGRVAWRNRSVGKGNCMAADQRLYCMGEDGAVGLIEPTPEAYKEISRFTIPHGGNPTWTPPAIAEGRLFLRDQDSLYCYNIKR